MERMKKTKIISSFLAVLLVLVLSVVMLPKQTSAETTNQESGVVVDKTAILEDDGTYTINLSAYATGTTTTVTEKSGEPLDIVLVLDQSGSMKDYLADLKTAAGSFIKTIKDNAEEYNVDHRIAIVGFAGATYSKSEYYYANTELFIGAKQYNYIEDGKESTENEIASTQYSNAFQNVTTSAGSGNLNASVNALAAKGGTHMDLGMEMANGIFDANPNTYTKADGTTGTRTRIVVMFTDGEPGDNGFDTTVANNALREAYATKNTYGASVYTVGLYSSAGDNVQTFMNYLSSNYPTAQSMEEYVYTPVYSGDLNTRETYYIASNDSYSSIKYTRKQWRINDKTYTPKTSANDSNENYTQFYTRTNASEPEKQSDKYYMTTSNSSELEKIFTNISNDIQNPSTTVTLNAESIMRDVLADGFVFPTGYIKDANITIKTVAGSTTDGKNITWGEEIPQPSGITSSISGNKVEITGFDYSQKYIAPSHDGEKLVVTIKGIEATDEAITDGIVNTNQEISGIYANSNSEIAANKFPQPTTKLTSKNYVLDFGKKVNLAASEWLQTSVTSLNGTGMNQFSTTNPLKDLTKSYGKVNLNATTPSGLTYTPTKINWDGYDSFYAFGKSNDTSVKAASANTNGNLWSKISVIPATSVYYEDDFMLTENTAKDSTVSIVYSNDWQVEGTSQDEAQSSANERYGYDSSYEGDWQLSNGSAHYVNGEGEESYATFTFTGTGVDIYSKTDMSSGVIAVTLYKGQSTEDQAEVKTLYVDNLYKSGTLYQIPTATFENLPHDKYTVKIMVADGGTTGGRNTYYLDGIRVYNPIDVEKENEVSQKAGAAYDKADERVDVTTEVRDTLLTANSFNAATLNNGSVFIDELNGTSTDVSTYEELGPKNEVYLAKGNAVAFEIKATYSGKTMIGMKAPNGTEGFITVSDGNEAGESAKNKIITVKSATDMYYVNFAKKLH